MVMPKTQKEERVYVMAKDRRGAELKVNAFVLSQMVEAEVSLTPFY